jgi:hypothetical protein
MTVMDLVARVMLMETETQSMSSAAHNRVTVVQRHDYVIVVGGCVNMDHKKRTGKKMREMRKTTLGETNTGKTMVMMGKENMGKENTGGKMMVKENTGKGMMRKEMMRKEMMGKENT